MKTSALISFLVFFSFISSCSEEDKEIENIEEIIVNTPPKTPKSRIEEGKQLIENTDCLTCHKTDAKLIGPSYQDIAAKYSEQDISNLAVRIIKGSVGVWGEMPMPAHSGLSEDNAKKMVEYILTLNQKK